MRLDEPTSGPIDLEQAVLPVKLVVPINKFDKAAPYLLSRRRNLITRGVGGRPVA